MVTIKFYTIHEDECGELFLMIQHHEFTRNMYKNVISALFEKAAEGCEYNTLSAFIKSEGEDGFHSYIDAITRVDGSTIYTDIFVNSQFIRRMIIAC